MEDVAKFLFGISGNVIALFLFLSPVHSSNGHVNTTICPFDHRPTFWRIIRNKSTEEFSGVPYNMTLLNCLLSAWYGLPFVSPNNVLVSTINGVGAVIETVYVVIFLVFASNRKARLRTLGLASAVAAVFAVVALVSMLALHGPARKLLAGLAMTVFSICMYASPLSIMRLVIKTKSVEYMPFLLSLAVFLCGTSWFIYGLLGHDLFVTIPNGCGSVLGAAQLILYAIYRNNKGNAASAGKLQGDDVEMSVDGRNSKVADGDDRGAAGSTKAGKMVSQV